MQMNKQGNELSSSFDSSYSNKGSLESYIDDLVYYIGFEDSNYVLTGHSSSSTASMSGSCIVSKWDRNDKIRKNHLFDYRGFWHYRPPFVDSTLATILSLSVQNLIQSILPAGIESIAVGVFGKRDDDRSAPTEFDEEGKLLADKLREVLDNPKLKFREVLQNSIFDLSLFGNAVVGLLFDEETRQVELQHFPFKKTYFGFKNDGKDLEWVYYRNEYSRTKGNEVVVKLFVIGDDNAWTMQKTIYYNQEIIEDTIKSWPVGFPAVIVCRDGVYSDTGYGFGAGMRSLNHVKTVNWAKDTAMYMAEKASNTVVAYRDGTVFTDKRAGKKLLDLTPGGTMSYSLPSNLLDRFPDLDPIKTLNTGADSPQLLNYLNILAEQGKQDLSKTFFVDPIISVGGDYSGDKTAREIIERKEQALVLYKSLSFLYKSTLLTPLLTAVFQIMVDTTGILEEEGFVYKTDIRYLSADTFSAAQNNANVSAQIVQFMTQAGQESEALTKYIKKYVESMNELII